MANCGNCFYPEPETIQRVADCYVANHSQALIGHQILPLMTEANQRYRLITYTDNLTGGLAPARGNDKLLTTSPYVLKGGETTISGSHYGEQVPVPPELLVPPDSCNTPHNIEDPLSEITEIVAQRIVASRERAIWEVLTNGSYTALDSSGQPLNQYQYNINQVSLNPVWDDPLNDRPLHDLMCVLQNQPTCCAWDQRATMYMNSRTLQCLLFNQNGTDLNMTGCCERGWDHLTTTLEKYRMPNIVTYDNSYIDHNGGREYYIKTGTILVIGALDMGGPVGNYMMMRTDGPCESASRDMVWIDDSCTRGEFPHRLSVRSASCGAPVIKKNKCVLSIQTGCAGLDC